MEKELLDYAEMLEIPVSSVSVSYKKSKKKIKTEKRADDLKDSVIKKLNENSTAMDDGYTAAELLDEKREETVQSDILEMPESIQEEKPKRRFFAKREHSEKKAPDEGSKRFNMIFAQIVIVCLLGAVLFLANIFWINENASAAFKNLFKGEETLPQDTRVYSDFDVAMPTSAAVTAGEDGALTFIAKGGVYAPVDGTVESIVQEENGTLTMTIVHNANFKSVIKGVDMAFLQEGESAFRSMPVAYSEGEEAVSVFFYEGDRIISDYTVGENNELVWAKSV